MLKKLNISLEFQEQEPMESLSSSSPFEMISSLLYVIVVLLILIGLIFLLVKFLSQRSKSFSTHRAMNHLAGIQLAHSKSLQLVEVGNCVYLVGVGEDVKLIDKISDPDEIEQIKLILSNDAPSLGDRGLKWIKNNWLDRKDRQANREENLDSTESFQEVFYRKMNQASDERRRQMEDWMKEASEDRTDKL